MPTFEPQSYYQNYVDGQFVDGGADRIVVDNPGTGVPLAEQASANAADIDTAVAAARRCHESGVLSAMRPVERGRMVRASAITFWRISMTSRSY